jgi:hypothetical protein
MNFYTDNDPTSPVENCFRCGTHLLFVKQTGNVQNFRCDSCHRAYTKRKGKGLSDTWPGPISLALYGLIFQTGPLTEVDMQRLVKSLQDLSTPEAGMLIQEIEEELSTPKQNVIDILDLNCSEEFARVYLGRLVLKLKAQREKA